MFLAGSLCPVSAQLLCGNPPLLKKIRGTELSCKDFSADKPPCPQNSRKSVQEALPLFLRLRYHLK